MIDVEKELKKLYKDTMYLHLLCEGYKSKQAKLEVGKIFDN